MDVLQMIDRFQRILNDLDPLFETQRRPVTNVIVNALNKAQNQYIQQKYLSGANMEERANTIAANYDDLHKMIFSVSLAKAADYEINYGQRYNLPQNYWHYVRSDSYIASSTINPGVSYYTPNIICSLEDIHRFWTTPFNTPVIIYPAVAELYPGYESLLVVRDKWTVLTTVYLTYLKKPYNLVPFATGEPDDATECELTSYLHEDIVNLAVQLFLAGQIKTEQ